MKEELEVLERNDTKFSGQGIERPCFSSMLCCLLSVLAQHPQVSVPTVLILCVSTVISCGSLSELCPWVVFNGSRPALKD